MKKLLSLSRPLSLAIISLLMVSCFLRYYLVVNTQQMALQFKNQNFNELYSLDTLKVSSRLNSLSSVINWVCIRGSINNHIFYNTNRGTCNTGLIQQSHEIFIPEANNTKIFFTVRLPREVEILFISFLILQSILIMAIIKYTKKNEEEKRKNEMKLNKLARQMSHDIRSPLATLNTILNENKSIPDNDLNLIRSSLLRINNISNSLLKETSSDNSLKNTLPLIRPVNINQTMQEVINDKKLEYKNNSFVNISLKHSTSLYYTCLLDENEFARSISNLINNSIEALDPAKMNNEVIITLDINANDLIIKISDTGLGISPDILNKIGKSEYSTKSEGNGLGLIHTFENIKNWNGTIEIYSELLIGTTITIILPTTITNIPYILLDNDELVRLTWQSRAKKVGVNLLVYSSSEELFLKLDSLPLESIFYIDSELDNEKGEDISKIIFNKGYRNLNMCSGYGEQKFSHLTFIKKTISKAPPF